MCYLITVDNMQLEIIGDLGVGAGLEGICIKESSEKRIDISPFPIP